MKRPGSVLRLAAPLKVLAQRFTFLGLVALSVGLMVFGKAEAPLVERARMAVTDAVIPILDAVSRPMATAAEIADRINVIVDVHAENARLREENERLLRWQTVAHRLEAENRSLRDLSRVAPEDSVSFVSGRVVADAGGTFVRSVLVMAGTRDGVAKGQTAITAEGLVGRVGEIGERSARVLLLTDLNSQVPIVIESSRERAILAGDNSERPKLTHLAVTARPQIGDRLMTSGHGGVFPPGLPVGIVVAVNDGIVRVKPFVEFHRLDHVRLVDFGLSGTLPVGAPPPAPRRGR
ncbi:MAG: rod shape-determining protein MreC [Candidatus Sericytochromatia bacterium]|uniref:Cell shape-determining protein MreC n=1 Tax=Candidatus Tanganyikabacteria bacterium TaxID=2961651 RepID=A0A937X6G5_9BACT|nr:rod shape-determining protein MreC [Candidatus Tanganyikabacteria bacterium]